MPLSRYFEDPIQAPLNIAPVDFLYPMQFQLPGVFTHNPLPYAVNDPDRSRTPLLMTAALGMTVWRREGPENVGSRLVCAAGFWLDFHPVEWARFEVVRNIACFAYGAFSGLCAIGSDCRAYVPLLVLLLFMRYLLLRHLRVLAICPGALHRRVVRIDVDASHQKALAVLGTSRMDSTHPADAYSRLP